MHDRERLWNGVDAAEKRKDARTARELLVALPRELTPEQRVEVVHTFARNEIVKHGLGPVEIQDSQTVLFMIQASFWRRLE